MGIYNNDSMFGLRIYNFNDDDFANILFEEKYHEIMSHQQMREAYLFYTEFNNKNELNSVLNHFFQLFLLFNSYFSRLVLVLINLYLNSYVTSMVSKLL